MPNENIQTEDICRSEVNVNAPRDPEVLNQADKAEEAKAAVTPQIRIDRYGNEIIPRAHRLK